jgi:hypothetical protein
MISQSSYVENFDFIIVICKFKFRLLWESISQDTHHGCFD